VGPIVNYYPAYTRRLGAKPNTLTWQPDVYSKESAMDCNRQPVLTPEQLEEPHLAMHLGMAKEMEQTVSEDLDHGALIMDIAQAAKLDHLAQELHSKLGTSDLPSGWEWLEGHLRFQGHLYVPNQEILCLQVISNHHNHLAAGHFREARTSELIHCNFHWLGLQRMVKDYMASCATCACCRWDISPMSKSPIQTGFDPLDVPHSLQVWNPVIRVLF